MRRHLEDVRSSRCQATEYRCELGRPREVVKRNQRRTDPAKRIQHIGAVRKGLDLDVHNPSTRGNGFEENRDLLIERTRELPSVRRASARRDDRGRRVAASDPLYDPGAGGRIVQMVDPKLQETLAAVAAGQGQVCRVAGVSMPDAYANLGQLKRDGHRASDVLSRLSQAP